MKYKAVQIEVAEKTELVRVGARSPSSNLRFFIWVRYDGKIEIRFG